jgi:hypothetical protein
MITELCTKIKSYNIKNTRSGSETDKKNLHTDDTNDNKNWLLISAVIYNLRTISVLFT